jgi:carbon monoxide dehydrogenase subunit G
MPRQTFQHSAITPASIESVWKALDDPTTWEAIPGVDRVIDPIVDASGRLHGFSFESVVGGKTYLGEARPAGREEERMMAWDIETSELKGRATVALSHFEESTRVYVRLDVEGVGMLGSVFFPVIASAVGGGFHETVEEFARVLGA